MTHDKVIQLINSLDLTDDKRAQLLARAMSLKGEKEIARFYENLLWLQKAQVVVDAGGALAKATKLLPQLKTEAGKIVKEEVEKEMEREKKSKEQEILDKIKQM